MPAQRLESGTKAAARNPTVVLAARRAAPRLEACGGASHVSVSQRADSLSASHRICAPKPPIGATHAHFDPSSRRKIAPRESAQPARKDSGRSASKAYGLRQLKVKLASACPCISSTPSHQVPLINVVRLAVFVAPTILVRNQLGQSPRKSWREVVTVTADDGAKAYAYQKPEGRLAWGVNAPETGVNILRGIRRPDGADEAEG